MSTVWRMAGVVLFVLVFIAIVAGVIAYRFSKSTRRKREALDMKIVETPLQSAQDTSCKDPELPLADL
jgi:type II secretory pathway pseudopilin PulG